MATEPCLVCCPEAEIPPGISDFVLELRRDYPAGSVVDPTWDRLLPGIATCWNCRGRRTVETNLVRSRQ